MNSSFTKLSEPCTIQLVAFNSDFDIEKPLKVLMQDHETNLIEREKTFNATKVLFPSLNSDCRLWQTYPALWDLR